MICRNVRAVYSAKMENLIRELDMSKHLDVAKTGLVLAAVVGGFHLGWSILVALGWAQPVMTSFSGCISSSRST